MLNFLLLSLFFFATVQKFRLLDYVTLLHATVEVMILKGLTSIFFIRYHSDCRGCFDIEGLANTTH